MEEENKVVPASPAEVKTESSEPAADLPPVPEASKAKDVSAETEKAEEVQIDKEEQAKAAAIDEMEKASQKALDAMREAGNEENSEIVDEAEEKIADLYSQFRIWVQENTQPEVVKARMEKLHEDTVHVLNTTRAKVEEVAQSEQFKKTMAAGKDFLTGTGAMISDGFKYGYDKLMEVPEFARAAKHVDEGVDKLRHSEALKGVVDSAEKGVQNLNDLIFNGLKSFFEGSATAPAKPESEPAAPAADEEHKAE